MNKNLNSNTKLPLSILIPEVKISEKISPETIQYFKDDYVNFHKQLNNDYNLGKLNDSRYLKLLKSAKKEYIKNINGENLATTICQHKKGRNNLIKNKYAFQRYVIWRNKNEQLLEVNKQIKTLKFAVNDATSFKNSNEYKSLIDKKKNIKISYKNDVKLAKENFVNSINNGNSSAYSKKMSIVCGNWKSYILTGGGIINRLVFVGIIIVFLLLGLIDQATQFLIVDSSIGSLSIFTFISSILVVLYIIALIIIFFRKRQGIYDVYETKHAKTKAASSGPVGSSTDVTDNWDYLDELFVEPKEVKPVSTHKKQKPKKVKPASKSHPKNKKRHSKK